MASTVTPWMRTFASDLFAPLGNFQDHHECANHELRVVDCLEAHGVTRGQEKCLILIRDFRECVLKSKQNARLIIMRTERERQIAAGELTGDDKYAPPPRMDSY